MILFCMNIKENKSERKDESLRPEIITPSLGLIERFKKIGEELQYFFFPSFKTIIITTFQVLVMAIVFSVFIFIADIVVVYLLNTISYDLVSYHN